jgi:hypothetical protein
MAGLVPAIHVLFGGDDWKEDVDARHKAGHDEREANVRLCRSWESGSAHQFFGL